MSVWLFDESSNGERFYYIKEWKGHDVSHIDFNVKGNYQCLSCAEQGLDNSCNNLHVFGYIS